MGNLDMVLKNHIGLKDKLLDQRHNSWELSCSKDLLDEAIDIAEGRLNQLPRVEHLQALLEWQGGSDTIKYKSDGF